MKSREAIALLLSGTCEMISTDIRYTDAFSIGISLELQSNQFAPPRYGVSVGVHLNNCPGEDKIAVIGPVGYANERPEQVIGYVLRQFGVPLEADWITFPEKRKRKVDGRRK